MAASPRKVLMLCGDYMEDYEAAVPLYALAALGIAVDCAAPGKRPGDSCLTAVHDFLGFETCSGQGVQEGGEGQVPSFASTTLRAPQLYTELTGHRFAVSVGFAAASADPSRYDALIIPGGRFAALRRPLVVTCHSQLLLAAAGVLRGAVRCTAFFSMGHVLEMAGGAWVHPEPLDLCLDDGHVLSAIGWPAHALIIDKLLHAMGARVVHAAAGRAGQRVLVLCADFVDDYEANVPFRALGGVSYHVDSACPTKRKGESVVTAIYDAMPAPDTTVSEERRGHNFVVIVDWADVSADDYDCVVIPGGRAPELLVTHERTVALVKEFADKGKVVATGQHRPGQPAPRRGGAAKGKEVRQRGAHEGRLEAGRRRGRPDRGRGR